jgi:hypothetical protein
MVPAPLATVMRRGIALEILEAPREYGLACGSELLDAPIRLGPRDRSGAGSGGAEASQGAEPTPPSAPEHPLPGVHEPRPGWPAAPAELPPAEGEAPEVPKAPEALLVDDGSLSDIDALLQEFGIETRRVQIAADGSFESCVRPTRLFVTTARLACSPSLPELRGDDGPVAIAVAEDESQTLSTMMRRLGFQYLVHRPTHPEALRLLLRRSLYRGAEHRRAARLPFGSEVVWRTGWRKQRGPMVEISATGCRLHAERGAQPGQRIRVWIPAEATGDRPIALRGRIARREAQVRVGERDGYALAVAFDAPSRRMQRRLDALLARSDRGPAMLPRQGPTERGAAAPPAAAALPPPSQAAPPPAPAPASAAAHAADAPSPPAVDRRRVPRVRLEREVVALDAAGTRALHALVGRDFSPLGMRVDPHPALALGQRLRLALYEPSVARPVVIDATVARDDGEAGLALHFVDVSPETAREIAHIAAALPALEALRPEPRRIVLGEWLDEQPAA